MLQLDDNIVNMVKEAENNLVDEFKKIDEICEYNSLKVLSAFKKYNV